MGGLAGGGGVGAPRRWESILAGANHHNQALTAHTDATTAKTKIQANVTMRAPKHSSRRAADGGPGGGWSTTGAIVCVMAVAFDSPQLVSVLNNVAVSVVSFPTMVAFT